MEFKKIDACKFRRTFSLRFEKTEKKPFSNDKEIYLRTKEKFLKNYASIKSKEYRITRNLLNAKIIQKHH